MNPYYAPPKPYKPGQGIRWSVRVVAIGGVLTDVAALTLTLQPPLSAPDAPIVDASPVHDGTGLYHSDQTIPSSATPGVWTCRWSVAGGTPETNAIDEMRFYVDALDF